MFGGDMDDMMSAFFGGAMGGGGGGRRRRKGRDVGHAFPVTLEDLYNGRKATIPREKTILCPACKGTGAKPGSQGGPCKDCRGQGARMVVRQIGPGMVQQMQVPCDSCAGQGMKVAEKDKCKECNMQRIKTVDAPLTVVVERGMEHEQQIPFMGEGDQHPDIETPGNVVVVLQQLKHETFKRDGMDLHIKQKLTLAEALCGFQFTIVHLDGRKLVVSSKPGEIIKPGQKKCIPKEGMPKWKDPTKKGDLVIEFEVEFPSTLHDEAVEGLRTALPPPPAVDANYNAAEAEHCTLTPQPLEEARKEMEKQDDDDEEEGSGGGGIRCAHQ